MVILVTGANGQLGNEMQIVAKQSNDKYIFTGDSLIQNTPTITRFKTSNNATYESTTRPFLKSLDKNMLVFPGHGEPFKISESQYL